VSFNFQRLDNSELYLILRTATLGKVKSFASSISYLRQLGTSSNPSRGKDFVVSISSETVIDEIQQIAKHIAAIAARADGAKAEDVAPRLHAIAAGRLREKLVAVLGWRATVKDVFKGRLPNVLVEYVKTFAGRFRSGKSSAAGGRPITREGMLDLAAGAGASAELLAAMRHELKDIESTMENGEFIAFVEAAAPELLPQGGRALAERAV